jgi:hypothetical protein
MSRKTIVILVSILFINTPFAGATFIPEEDIKITQRVFSAEEANITESEFNEAIEKARAHYTPIVASHGARLVINGNWYDDTLNASASQVGSNWRVNMYGGLARHPEMTLDGFVMVLCHEMGHHLAGFSFTRPLWGRVWAANEGQSDYYAAHICTRDLWRDELELNATYKEKAHPLAIERCDLSWESEEDRNLCYRINAGGESLARVLSALKKDDSFPQFDTPDANKVNQTDNRHPQAQCRLDTTFAASVCRAPFDNDIIPGKRASDPNGAEAEIESSQYTCMEISGFDEGLRPRCWFSPGV